MGRADSYGSEFELIQDASRMSLILNGLIERHTLLSIASGESRNSFNSTLVRIDPGSGLLWLDEAHDDRIHREILEARELSASARSRGVQVKFDTSLLPGEDCLRDNCYLALFPRALRYFQRREHYRASPRKARPAPVYLRSGSGRVITARLQDISMGGLRIALDDLPVEFSAPGKLIGECVVPLPWSLQLVCVLEIRSVSSRRRDDSAHSIGARFVKLNRRAEAELAQYVAALDRESVQRAVSALN
jgi:c-di-GMP-binding flagellar brake protein YcgR